MKVRVDEKRKSDANRGDPFDLLVGLSGSVLRRYGVIAFIGFSDKQELGMRFARL
jgi:hypothetical protein